MAFPNDAVKMKPDAADAGAAIGPTEDIIAPANEEMVTVQVPIGIVDDAMAAIDALKGALQGPTGPTGGATGPTGGTGPTGMNSPEQLASEIEGMRKSNPY